jgi:hypothetical protein
LSFEVVTDGEAKVVEAVVDLCIEKLVPVVAAMSARLDQVEADAARLGIKP